MAMIRLRDPEGRPLAGVSVRLSPRGQDFVAFDQIADPAGQTDFTYAGLGMKYALNNDALLFTLHANNTEAFYPGWKTLEQKAVDVETDFWNRDVDIVLAHQHGSGGESLPLHMDGLTIRTSDAKVWRYAGVTAFRLYRMFLNGEDVDAIVTDYLTCGGLVDIGRGPNTFRALQSASVLFDLPTGATNPDTLRAFYAWLASRGARCEGVVLADANPDPVLYPTARPTARTQAEQQAFLDLCAPVMAGAWNAIGELGNECSHLITRVDRGAFTRPAGAILWERGSGQGDEPPFSPPWDLVGDHPGRPDDWPRRLPARDIRSTDGPPWGIHCAAIENEPMGAADTNQPGRRSNVPDDFAQFAAHAGMNSNGACFHPEVGLLTSLLTPTQAQLGAAFFAGLHFSPPEAQEWPYRRGGLSGPQASVIAHSDRYDNAGNEADAAGALRTFSKEGPTGDGYSVAIRPGPDWAPIALEGRRIVATPRRGLVRTQR